MYRQVVLRLGLIVEGLKSPASGLVTPIEVERFENGVRIIFKPLGSSYSSKNDERKIEKKEEIIPEKKSQAASKNTGYLSPEMEKAQEEREAREEKEKAEESKKKVEPKKFSSLVKLEGGLEIIVESVPYRRVRVKRCLMGPQTVVKVESEALLLKSILRGLQVLENDYRIALMTSFKV